MTSYRVVTRELKKQEMPQDRLRSLGGRKDLDLENPDGDFKWFWSGVRVCESQTNVLNCLF